MDEGEGISVLTDITKGGVFNSPTLIVDCKYIPVFLSVVTLPTLKLLFKCVVYTYLHINLIFYYSMATSIIVELQSAFSGLGGVTILKFDFISFLYLLYLLSLHYESGLKTTLYGILLLIYYVNICLLIDTVSLHTLKYDYQCI